MNKAYEAGQTVIVTRKLEGGETVGGTGGFPHPQPVGLPHGYSVYPNFVNSWESEMDQAIGLSGTIVGVDPELGITIDFGDRKDAASFGFYHYPPQVLELVPPSDAPTLTQVIVNTKGLVRSMTQYRDDRGRFIKGADVSLLLTPGKVLGQNESAVVVHYGYSDYEQTVTSLNPNTGRMACKTYSNDGLSKSSEHTVQV